mmetsp:Transcript_20427/g.42864  ORF Transcript_20427/g.42864 Transcript_20427/m.42864 type:complete len:254 (+) Transcript_20427:361-1122(+)
MCATILTDSVHFFIIFVLRIGNHRVNPRTLVIGIINHFWLPGPLVLRVINHRRLPLTIVLIVPIIGFLSVGIGDFLWNVVVSLWLFILGIGNFLFIHPIRGLRLIGVFNFLRWKEVELVIKLSRSDGFVIDEDFEGVIRTKDEGVKVTELVVFSPDVFLDEEIVVFLVVVKDDVRAFVGRSANIGPEHNGVRGIASEFLSVKAISPGKEFDVGSSAVDFLLVFHSVLDYEVLLFGTVESFRRGSAETVKSSVL